MTTPTPQTCETCRQYEPSRLAAYGYCAAAPTLETRARLLPWETPCVFGAWAAKRGAE